MWMKEAECVNECLKAKKEVISRVLSKMQFKFFNHLYFYENISVKLKDLCKNTPWSILYGFLLGLFNPVDEFIDPVRELTRYMG